jgi:hypothetical protein
MTKGHPVSNCPACGSTQIRIAPDPSSAQIRVSPFLTRRRARCGARWIQRATADPALDTIEPGDQIAISWDEAAPLLLGDAASPEPAPQEEEP